MSGWDGLVAVGLFVVALAYVCGVWRLWRRAQPGRGVREWEVAAFALGWTTLVVALLSPLDGLSEVLFVAHMTQHELLMLVAAPLVVVGQPLVAIARLLPPGGRRPLRRLQRAGLPSWQRLAAPLPAVLQHAAVVWVWHAPVLFEAALAHDGVHALQHLFFFWSAALFWWAMVHGRFGRLGYGVSVLFVFVTALHTSVLGALLTFAPRAWYPTYAARTTESWLSPIDDQQLAGLVMWVPGGVLFLLIGLALFAAWLGRCEAVAAREVQRRA